MFCTMLFIIFNLHDWFCFMLLFLAVHLHLHSAAFGAAFLAVCLCQDSAFHLSYRHVLYYVIYQRALIFKPAWLVLLHATFLAVHLCLVLLLVLLFWPSVSIRIVPSIILSYRHVLYYAVYQWALIFQPAWPVPLWSALVPLFWPSISI